MTTTSARFQQNGYTAAYLASQNPVPANRELMFETDTLRFKIGDGVSAWNALRYFYGRAETLADIAAVKPPAGRNAVTGWFHVNDFGALGDGVTDDSTAIQAAINAANSAAGDIGRAQVVYFANRRYRVGVKPYYKSDGTQDGICSLFLKDGVELYGQARIQVLDHAYGPGAYYAMVRSAYEGLSLAGIRGLTFDGNRSNQVASTNAGNLLLESLANVWVKDVTCYESNGNAIMVRGNAYGAAATDIRVEDCLVDGANGIGIQCAQFYGAQILDNTVKNTSDNSIDVYGEYGDHSTTSHAGTFVISGNHCSNGGVGIFLETVVDGVCVGNVINSCTEGFHINRINGEPHNLGIRANTVSDCATAVGFTGDSGGVTIQNNTFERFTVGGVVCGGAGNVGSVYILDNTMNGVNASTPLVMIKSGTHQTSNFVHLRTMTRSKNRAYDTLNFGPPTVSSSWAPAFSPGD